MIEIKSDKIITPSGVKKGYLYFDNQTIVGVFDEQKPADKRYDLSGKYVSAGFIDMHVHGGAGHPFINGTVDDVIKACNFHLTHGTTAILPTVTAGAFPTMREAVEKIAEAKQSGKVKSNIIGAHLEGPYLSAKSCNARYL